MTMEYDGDENVMAGQRRVTKASHRAKVCSFHRLTQQCPEDRLT